MAAVVEAYVKRCAHERCGKPAHAGRFCGAHRVRKMCVLPGCGKKAEWPTNQCIAHGGGRRCSHEGCATGAVKGFDMCSKHGGGLRCSHEGCAIGAVNGFRVCVRHGGGPRCSHESCASGAIHGFDACKKHGAGIRCIHEGCTTAAQSGFTTCTKHGAKRFCSFTGCDKKDKGGGRCVRHSGGYRCQTEACSVYTPPPPARYRSSTLRVCWACFVVLEPDKAKLKIRSEHYIVDELTRRMPGLMTRARSATWDCTAPGGCSLKRADLLYILDDRYIQIEVDERGHAGYDCYDEDTRLEIIAADVGLPGVVLRLNPDAPPCFRPKRLSNGEIAVQISNRAALDSLMTQACEAIATYLDNPPPPTLVRLYLPRVS